MHYLLLDARQQDEVVDGPNRIMNQELDFLAFTAPLLSDECQERWVQVGGASAKLSARIAVGGTMEAIVVDVVRQGFSLSEVLGLLSKACSDGFLADSESGNLEREAVLPSTPFETGLDSFASQAGTSVTGRQAAQRLEKSCVILVGDGRSHKIAQDLLTEMNVGNIVVVDDLVSLPDRLPEVNRDPICIAYCADKYDAQVALHLNEIAIEFGLPYLPYRNALTHIDIGPLVVPGQTPCLQCCDIRRQAVLLPPEREAELRAVPALPFPVGIEAMCLELLRWLSGISLPVTISKLQRLDLISGTTTLHTVLRVPRCPSCGPRPKRPQLKHWDGQESEIAQ